MAVCVTDDRIVFISYGVGDGVGDAVGANVFAHDASDMITFASEIPKSAAICVTICASKSVQSGNETHPAPAYGFAAYKSTVVE